MNILHLSAVKNWGGGENHIENLCTELKTSHPEVNNFILCVENSAFHRRLKESELSFITGKLSIKIDIRFAIKIGIVCKKHKIDLIHIHDPVAIQLAIMADRIFQLPYFIFSKKTSFPIKQRKKTLFKYNYYKIRKVLCVSNETKVVASKGIKDHSKLVTIYHGTNIKTKSVLTPFLLRDKFNIKEDITIIGNIANHIRAKNLDTLIDVANRLVNDHGIKDLRFVQIGTFTDRTEGLMNRISDLNLGGFFIFLGYLEKASNFIPQFDISLMTSQSEGLPQFLYESMYHKTPIVSTNVGGIPEIVQHGYNGFLSPMHDYKSLSENLIKLLRDKKLQTSFTKRSQEILLNGYTTEVMANNTYNVYKSILDGLPT